MSTTSGLPRPQKPRQGDFSAGEGPGRPALSLKVKDAGGGRGRGGAQAAAAQAPPRGSLPPGAPRVSSPRRVAGWWAPQRIRGREMTLPGGPTGMARPGGGGHCSPGLERAPRRSVGELRLLFEARCAAVAAAAAAGEPRARGAKRRGGQVPNGLPRAPPAPVIPQLTVTSEEPDAPPASPGPPEPEGGWLPAAGSSHLRQPRRLSTSSLSSTGSSSLPDDSEDDLLSDSESRSRGNVQLEAGEDAGQVRAAGAGPGRRAGDPAPSSPRSDCGPKAPRPRAGVSLPGALRGRREAPADLSPWQFLPRFLRRFSGRALGRLRRRVRRSLRLATGTEWGGERRVVTGLLRDGTWRDGGWGGLAPRTLGARGARESLHLAAPSPAPRPHPRRCHGFPLLSGSGAALQAQLGSRRRLLAAPARGVDAGKEERGAGRPGRQRNAALRVPCYELWPREGKLRPERRDQPAGRRL